MNETHKYRGYQINIVQDEDPEDPREWGNLGRMLCSHRRYNLGDSLDQAAPGWSRGWEQPYSSWSEIEDAIYSDLDAAVCLPLYLYDHSGITISTRPFSCSWDSGQVGFIYATRTDILAEYSRKHLSKKLRQAVENILVGEVGIYDQYLTGQVYGYTVTDDAGEVVDSCYGFYSADHILDQAKGWIDWEIKQRTEEHAKQVKSWIRNKVPLEYRYALGGTQ